MVVEAGHVDTRGPGAFRESGLEGRASYGGRLREDDAVAWKGAAAADHGKMGECSI